MRCAIPVDYEQGGPIDGSSSDVEVLFFDSVRSLDLAVQQPLSFLMPPPFTPLGNVPTSDPNEKVACGDQNRCKPNPLDSTTGICDCPEGTFGPGCGGRCPGYPNSVCNNKGTCSHGRTGSGECTCDSDHYGTGCTKTCLTAIPAQRICCSVCAVGTIPCGDTCIPVSSSCNLPVGCACSTTDYLASMSSEQPLICSGQGLCSSEGCQCSNPYVTGTACGVCSFGRFAYPACNGECPGGILKPCSGRGRCSDETQGKCKCHPGFVGSECQYECPASSSTFGVCNGRGICTDTGSCICTDGWSGDGCEVNCRAKYKCSSGWHLSGSTCYRESTTVGTWSEALWSCHSMSAALGRLDAEEKSLFAGQLSRDDVWFGLQLPTGLWNGWYWEGTDYVEPSMTFWQDGRPDNYGRCASLSHIRSLGRKKWVDSPCSTKKKWICTQNAVLLSPQSSKAVSTSQLTLDMRNLLTVGPCSEPCAAPEPSADSTSTKLKLSVGTISPRWYVTPFSTSGTYQVSALIGSEVTKSNNGGAYGLTVGLSSPKELRDTYVDCVTIFVRNSEVVVARLKGTFETKLSWTNAFMGETQAGVTILAIDEEVNKLEQTSLYIEAYVNPTTQQLIVFADNKKIYSGVLPLGLQLLESSRTGFFSFDCRDAIFRNLKVQPAEEVTTLPQCPEYKFGVKIGEGSHLSVPSSRGLVSKADRNWRINSGGIVLSINGIQLSSKTTISLTSGTNTLLVDVYPNGALIIATDYQFSPVSVGTYTAGNQIEMSSCDGTVSLTIEVGLEQPQFSAIFVTSTADRQQFIKGDRIGRIYVSHVVNGVPLLLIDTSILNSFRISRIRKSNDVEGDSTELMSIMEANGDIHLSDLRVEQYHAASLWKQTFVVDVTLEDIYEGQHTFTANLVINSLPISAPCSGHGSCSSTGCDCGATGFAGQLCDRCTANYFGPSCTPCLNCNSGMCNDGIGGDGECICFAGSFGQSCGSQCPTVDSKVCNHHGTCNDGITGTGVCTCESGWKGLSCSSPCPGVTTSGTICSSHGSCFENPLTEVAFCVCSTGYSGPDCSETPPEPASMCHTYQFNEQTLSPMYPSLSPTVTAECGCETVILCTCDAYVTTDRGAAFKFNGYDAATQSGSQLSSASADFEFVDDISIIVWIQIPGFNAFSNLGSDNGVVTILHKTSSQASYSLTLQRQGATSTASVTFSVSDGSGEVYSISSSELLSSTTGTLKNDYYFVAASLTSSNISICVNNNCDLSAIIRSTPTLLWDVDVSSLTIGKGVSQSDFLFANLEEIIICDEGYSTSDLIRKYSQVIDTRIIEKTSPGVSNWKGGRQLVIEGANLPLSNQDGSVIVKVGTRKATILSTSDSAIVIVIPMAVNGFLASGTTVPIQVLHCDLPGQDDTCTAVACSSAAAGTCSLQYAGYDTGNELCYVFHMQQTTKSVSFTKSYSTSGDVQVVPVEGLIIPYMLSSVVPGDFNFESSPFGPSLTDYAMRLDGRTFTADGAKFWWPELTVSFWVKFDSFEWCISQSGCPLIRLTDSNGQRGYTILVDPVNEQLFPSVEVDSSSRVTSTQALNTNSWQYLTAIIKSNNVFICVNQVCDGASLSSTPLQPESDHEFEIGIGTPNVAIDEIYVCPHAEDTTEIINRYESYQSADPNLVVTISHDTAPQSHMTPTVMTGGANLPLSDTLFYWRIASPSGLKLQDTMTSTPIVGSRVIKVNGGVLEPGRYVFELCAAVGVFPVCATREIDIFAPPEMSRLSAVCTSTIMGCSETDTTVGIALRSPWTFTVGEVVGSGPFTYQISYIRPATMPYLPGTTELLTNGFEAATVLSNIILPEAPEGLEIKAEVRDANGLVGEIATFVYVTAAPTTDTNAACMASINSILQQGGDPSAYLSMCAAILDTERATLLGTGLSRHVSVLQVGGEKSLLQQYVDVKNAQIRSGIILSPHQVISAIAQLSDVTPVTSVSDIITCCQLLVVVLPTWDALVDINPEILQSNTLRAVSNMQYYLQSINRSAASTMEANLAIDSVMEAFLYAVLASRVTNEVPYITPAGFAGAHVGSVVKLSLTAGRNVQRSISVNEFSIHLSFGKLEYPVGEKWLSIVVMGRSANVYLTPSTWKAVSGVVSVKNASPNITEIEKSYHVIDITCEGCQHQMLSTGFSCAIKESDNTWSQTGVVTAHVGNGKASCQVERLPATLAVFFTGSDSDWKPNKPTVPPPVTPTPQTVSPDVVQTDVPDQSSLSSTYRIHIQKQPINVNPQDVISIILNLLKCSDIIVSVSRVCPEYLTKTLWSQCVVSPGASRSVVTLDGLIYNTTLDISLTGNTSQLLECSEALTGEANKSATQRSGEFSDYVPPYHIVTGSNVEKDPKTGGDDVEIPVVTEKPTEVPVIIKTSSEDVVSGAVLVLIFVVAGVLLVIMLFGTWWVFIRPYEGAKKLDDSPTDVFGAVASTTQTREMSPRGDTVG